MKIAITGGHLTPALAVIEALPKDTKIIFIGRKYPFEGDKTVSLEYETIKSYGIDFAELDAGRLQRNLSRYTLWSLFKSPLSLAKALLILIKNKPDLVLTFGGYISVPVGLAASILNIPLVIHEQTLAAGLANKILSPYAKKICISWRQSLKYFPSAKTVITGNPVRRMGLNKKKLNISKDKYPLIYITGGSTGSHALNNLVKGCLYELLEYAAVVHLTGSASAFGDYEHLNELSHKLPPSRQSRYILKKTIDPYAVAEVMHMADFIISRAGINTVTEILLFGKPCLLIPLPYGQKNEQLNNAKFIKKTGLGDYLIQDGLNPSDFLKKILNMLDNKSKYQVYANEAKKLIRSDAADRIVKIIYDTVQEKK